MTRYAVAILLALTMRASAQDWHSVNHFLPGCKAFLGRESKPIPTGAVGRCTGFVEGLVYGGGGNHFCSPQGVTIDQALAVVVKYIEARPERMHEQFGDLALEALTAAWPCNR